MMNQPTYYKPTIEEFFVGFEYEISYRLNDGNWQPKVYSWSDAAIPLYFLDYVRVKHLDHDDIVSLGWEVKNNIGSVTRYIIFNGHELTTNDKGSSIRINGVIYDLLNKSELSRLMRQLGITKNETK